MGDTFDEYPFAQFSVTSLMFAEPPSPNTNILLATASFTAALSATPDWFQWAVYASIGASFGLRSLKGFKK